MQISSYPFSHGIVAVKRILLAILGIVCVAGLASQLASRPPPGPKRLVPASTEVTGTIAIQGLSNLTAVAVVKRPGLVVLPDIPLELRDLLTQKTVAKTTSALNGYFTLNAPKESRYALCWDVNGITGCTKPFAAGTRVVALRIVTIPVPPTRIMGSVLTGDGRPCWVSDHFFNLDVSTTVSAALTGTSNVVRQVRANTQGEFALINLPAGQYDVVAKCENATRAGVATVGQVPPLMINLGNHAPRIRDVSLMAPSGTARVRIKQPGAAARVVADAVDRDNDPIEYIWRSNDGSPAQVSPSAERSLTVPDSGIQSTYLMARDGKGGYAYRRYDVTPTPKRVTFSGTVLDETTNQPVSGAVVSVDNQQFQTGPTGWFGVTVNPRDDSRYVLNIRHSGYALNSRLFDDSNTGGSYDLIRTQISTQPANAPIAITDTRSSGPCGTGPEGRKAAVIRQAALRIYEGDPALNGRDADAETRAMMKTALAAQTRAATVKCAQRGATITAKAGAFVTARGGTVTGNITASVATLDPTRRSLPGDYRAAAGGNREGSLQSFGAVYAEFRDAGGQKLKLADGQTATLRIPIPQGERAVAGRTDFKLWSYDEARGLWVDEGKGTIEDTPDGSFFVAETKHFSVLNFDQLINSANQTCVRLDVPSSVLTGYTNLKLRGYVTYTDSGTVVSEAHDAYDPITTEFSGIYWLPFGAATAPNTLRLEVTGTDSHSNTDVILNDIVNIDQVWQASGLSPTLPAAFNYWGDPTHAECVTIPLGSLQNGGLTDIPKYGIDATGRPFFLMGPVNVATNPDGFNPDPAHFDPDTYYANIGAEATLGAWWSDHGFDQTGVAAGNTSYTRAGYLNDNDLGFGRDMNCLKENNGAGPNVACYVTNFGLPDQNPANADAAEGHNPLNAAATVTMTYNTGATAGQEVQFYVYGGASPGSQRLKYADLDGFGPKPVPQLCTVCHGGRYNSGAGRAVGSHFREFDVPSFKFSHGRAWTYGDGSSPSTLGPHLTDAEFTAFTRLNKMVRDGPSNQAQKDLINTWYPLGFVGAKQPVLPGVGSLAMTNWTDAGYYNNAYGKACRTCHIARDDKDFNSQTAATPTTPYGYNGTSYLVCGSGRVMPNAIVTFKNFWIKDLGTRVTAYEGVTGTTGTCRND
jgi:hypothetical protein